ncbi:MAG UNVERIFIED_CONTAM: type II toxin-antitoxin system VapC family toxin [Microcystis novacekii LVE1205-3]|jgi:tRNA(fMet)-specific endonuclease VapC
MYLLDTDHISILDLQGDNLAQQLLKKLAAITSSEVATTIITYEEQMRGWLSYIAKANSIEVQVVAYRRLEKHLANYRTIPIVGFDEKAGQVFQELRVTYPRLGSMDLKIAAISMVNQAILLTQKSLRFWANCQFKSRRLDDYKQLNYPEKTTLTANHPEIIYICFYKCTSSAIEDYENLRINTLILE